MDDEPTRDGQGKKEHKPAAFISMGALIGIGAGIGLVFGVVLDNIALGLAIGAGLGVVAGAVLEENRKGR